MTDDDLMNEFVESVEYVGRQMNWRDVPPDDRDDDEDVDLESVLDTVEEPSMGLRRRHRTLDLGNRALYDEGLYPAERAARALKERGTIAVKVSDGDRATARVVFGEDVERVAQDMFGSVGGREVQVTTDTGPTSDTVILEIPKTRDGLNVKVVITKDDEKGMSSTLDQLHVGAKQQGTASKILRDVMDVQQRLGVEEMKVFAVRDGSYAWARLGFEATDPRLFTAMAFNRLDSAVTRGAISQADAKVVRSVISENRDNPKVSRLLAGLRSGDTNIGSALLRGGGWEGRIRPRDSSAMAYFNQYIAGKGLSRKTNLGNRANYEDGLYPAERAARDRAIAGLQTASKAGIETIDQLVPQVGEQVPRQWVVGVGTERVHAADVERTKKLARALVTARTEQLLAERGLEAEGADALRAGAWNAWKTSSSSDDSLAFQIATARELGGDHKIPAADVKRIEDKYGSDLPKLKALARAQWETTQFLLDKAGVDHVPVYRALLPEREKIHQQKQERVGSLTKLPELTLTRAGLQSMTADPRIANEWTGWAGDKRATIPENRERIVIRAKVPKTSVMHVPVYGDNVDWQKEVVVVGTKDRWDWDVWRDRAPEHD